MAVNRNDQEKCDDGIMTLGLAVIARNAEKTLDKALAPFVGLVDEFAFVLGGESSDGTKERLCFWEAQLFDSGATGSVAQYEGDLDDDGRILDFAACRQQAADMLGSDWMIAVDTDEEWHGVEQLSDLIADADKRGFPLVIFPYRVGSGRLIRPLLMRRESGRWAAPVHEYWELNDPQAQAMATDVIWIEQRKEPSADRGGHNIALAERWLKSNEPTSRILANLGKDYLRAERYQDALDTFKRYLLSYDPKSGRDDELFMIHYSRGAAFLRLTRFADAIQAATMALSVRPFGMAWTLMSEASLLLAQTSSRAWALADLAVVAADKALASGHQSTTFWSSRDMVTTIPLKLKIRALAWMGRKREALACAELLCETGDDDAEKMRVELCQKLGVLC
jgi:tetratricopeptide (TPR) repeat protein